MIVLVQENHDKMLKFHSSPTFLRHCGFDHANLVSSFRGNWFQIFTKHFTK